MVFCTKSLHGQSHSETEEPWQTMQNLLDSAVVLSEDNIAISTSIIEEVEKRVELGSDPRERIKGYAMLADYYESTDNNSISVDFLQKAFQLATTHNLKSESAEFLKSIGINYQYQSRYDSAMIYLTRSLRIFEELKDSSGTHLSLSGIANLHLEMLHLDDAMHYLNKVTPIVTALHDSAGLCTNIHQKGALYQKLGEFDKALANYRSALEMSLKLGNKLQAAVLYGNIGSTLTGIGNEEGLDHLQTALRMKKEFGASTKSILHTLMDLALCELQFNRPEKAAEYSQQVIDESKAANDGYSLKYGYFFLSKSYRDLGNYKMAYDFQQLYINIKDSLLDIEKSNQIKELQIAYETEKKDKAIQTLGLEMEIESSTKQLYLYLGIVILLLGTGIYYLQRLKTKKNKQLFEQGQEINRIKSNFFANISHEFRTPLTLIMGPVESLLEKNEVADQKQHLLLIKKNASRLLNLINDILDLTKFEAGHLHLQAGRCDIIGIIRGVAMTFSSLAESRGIKYTVDIDLERDSLDAYFDQSKVETIMINLLSNAFKFTPDNGNIILTASKVLDQGTEAIEIAVTDTGAGIPADKLSRIFDRFYQVDDSATRKFQGTGIGLAFTKQLVEMHSGKITVDSELGEGTSVKVVLPLGNHHLNPENVIVETEYVNQANTVHPLEDEFLQTTGIEEENEDKPIVLIIEDNEDVRKYIQSILHTEYRVKQAVDGEEGVNAAFELIPDLIISDVMMPKMDGFEVSRTLKQDAKTSHIPLILLTAKSSDSSRLTGLETEADVYLNKPFLPRELLLQIKNLINSRKLLREKYKGRELLKPEEIAINSVDEQFLKRLLTVMEKYYSNPEFTVEKLGEEIGMSRSQLHRKLHALTNESTSQFIRTFRLQKAMMLIKAKSGNISEIAYQVGFNNVSYFNKCFLELYNCRPGEVD